LVAENPLLHWRKRHHVTQAALGKACGVSAGTISQIEHRHIEPTVRLVARLSRHTGISVARLVSFAVGGSEFSRAETVIDFAAKAGERKRTG
jgi:transcriptional regulator with XRE-family HTH domain